MLFGSTFGAQPKEKEICRASANMYIEPKNEQTTHVLPKDSTNIKYIEY